MNSGSPTPPAEAHESTECAREHVKNAPCEPCAGTSPFQFGTSEGQEGSTKDEGLAAASWPLRKKSVSFTPGVAPADDTPDVGKPSGSAPELNGEFFEKFDALVAVVDAMRMRKGSSRGISNGTSSFDKGRAGRRGTIRVQANASKAAGAAGACALIDGTSPELRRITSSSNPNSFIRVGPSFPRTPTAAGSSAAVSREMRARVTPTPEALRPRESLRKAKPVEQESAAGSVRNNGIRAAAVRRLGLMENHPLVTLADVAYVSASVLILAAAVSGLTPSQSASIWAAVAVIVVAQLVTIAWTALRFFVQVRTGAWEIIAHIPDIRKHYRETWLAFDVVCALPLDLVLLAWGVAPFFWAQVRQVVRLVRIVHLTRSSNPLRESRLWLQLYVFLAMLLFAIHTAACVFQALDGHSYIDSLYWTASTMSSVGYGDVVPHDLAGSRGYAIVIMFLGVGCVASVTAFTTTFLTSRDALEETSREKKQMLASMLEYYRIPWDEQIEIIGLFPTALDAENERNFTQLVQNMPAFIVERIEGYTRAKALSGSIPMFSELPVNIVLEMTSKLHHRFVQANDAIIKFGTEGHEMFFLVRGIADVVMPISDVDEIVVAVLRSGAFFGERALLQSTTRNASVMAVVPCELLVLSQVDFEELTAHEALERIFNDVVFARNDINEQCAANPLSATGFDPTQFSVSSPQASQPGSRAEPPPNRHTPGDGEFTAM